MVVSGVDTAPAAEATANARLAGKAYKAALDEVVATTRVRPNDFDQKAVHLLDFLQRRGTRAAGALRFLKQAADGVERQDIINWRAYTYTLLRKFDEAAYREMKATEAWPQPAAAAAAAPATPRGEALRLSLNPEAPEFVPGQEWEGLEGASAEVRALPPLFGLFPGAPYPGVCLPGGFLPLLEAPGCAAPVEAVLPPAPSPGSARRPQRAAEVALLAAAPAPPAAAAPPSPGPRRPPLELAPAPLVWSEGSASHELRLCKPCAFYHTKGCASGARCQFCHLCGPGEKKKRKKDARHDFLGLQPLAAGGPPQPSSPAEAAAPLSDALS